MVLFRQKAYKPELCLICILIFVNHDIFISVLIMSKNIGEFFKKLNG